MAGRTIGVGDAYSARAMATARVGQGDERRPTDGPTTSIASTGRMSGVQAAVIVLPAVALAVAAWLRRWTTDDAFINFRIVDQILAGHGPVFNAGERVEAATSTLWLALLTVGDVVLPFDISYVAIALSIPLAGAGLVAMSVAARRLLGPAIDEESVLWVPAGALLLVAVPAVWDFTTAGLETGLTLAWVGVVALVVARTVERPELAPRWALVAVGLGPLVRPDEAIVTVAVLAFVAVGTWRTGSRRTAVKQVATAAAIPVAYQVFRMAYYAALVPNTALAKQADVPHWHEGWAYLLDLMGPYALYVPLALVLASGAVLARRLPARRQVAVALLPMAALLHTLFLVRAGGDYIHARLLLPPLFALVAPVAVLPLRRSVAAVPLVGLAVWAAICAGFLRVGDARLVENTIIADGRRAAVGGLGVDHPVTAADQGWPHDGQRAARLRNNPITVNELGLDVVAADGLRTPAAALYGVGITGYAAGVDVHVIDRLGLGNAVVSRFELAEPGFIAHEKPMPSAWLAAVLAAPGEVTDPSQIGGTGYANPLYESTPEGFGADTDAARAALGCGELADLQEAITAPLTPGRLLSNLWHAPGYTDLRLAPDPKRAEADLCP